MVSPSSSRLPAIVSSPHSQHVMADSRHLSDPPAATEPKKMSTAPVVTHQGARRKPVSVKIFCQTLSHNMASAHPASDSSDEEEYNADHPNPLWQHLFGAAAPVMQTAEKQAAAAAVALEKKMWSLIDQLKERDFKTLIIMMEQMCARKEYLFAELRTKNTSTWQLIRSSRDELAKANPDYDHNRGACISFWHLPFSMDLTDVRPVLFFCIPDTCCENHFTMAAVHCQCRGAHRTVGAEEMMHARVALIPATSLTELCRCVSSSSSWNSSKSSETDLCLQSAGAASPHGHHPSFCSSAG